ncbi:hypothetical protein K438DRAFT_1795074 [Mycena galopus ATCC 62051]|nr:hypothetical protein K438DRAFT_1795074 [Mycena galopus ATCC 62051]
MGRISCILVRGRKRVQNFVKGSFGRLKSNGANHQDLLWTSLTALRTSSSACPPLNGVVSILVAIFEISERMTHSKQNARELAGHSVDLLRMLADAASDRDGIPEPMLASLVCFESVLTKIHAEVDQLVGRGFVWRVKHLNRNEKKLRSLNRRLKDASRTFELGSAARTEASVAQLHRTSLASFILHNNEIFLLRGIILIQVFFCPSPVWRFRGAQLELRQALRPVSLSIIFNYSCSRWTRGFGGCPTMSTKISKPAAGCSLQGLLASRK